MLSLLRKQLFFILAFNFLTINSFSQLDYSNGRAVRIIMRSSPPSPADRDSLINIFIQKTHGHIEFDFKNGNGAKKAVLMEDLFPIIKDSIEAFTIGYIKNPLKDIDLEKRAKVAPIYERIQELLAKHSNDSNEIKEVLKSINDLPNSKEKVWLQLQYSVLDMPFAQLYDKVLNACLNAQTQANSIKDLYERGSAYIYIGDFAAETETKDVAILAYYLAKENFYNCHADSTLKCEAQGLVCEKIASLFPYRRYNSGIQKRINYYVSASYYFLHTKDSGKIELNLSKQVLYKSILLTKTPLFNDKPALYRQEETKILQDLFSLYKIKNGPNFSTLTSIATILESEHKYEAALSYYLFALLHAHKGRNIEDIYEGLFNAAFAYSLVGKEKQAISFANLAIALAERQNDRVVYYRALYEKANDFYKLNKYDSALVYVNKNFGSISLRSFFDLAPSRISLEQAYSLKFLIYYNRKSDSCWYYKSVGYAVQAVRIQEYEQLLQTESQAMTEWLERVKSKEVDTEKELREEILYKNYGLLGVSIVLFISLAGIAYFFWKDRKKSKELLEYSTFDLKLRSAIQNHNLANHYSKIKEMIRENRREEAGDYCEATSTYFDEFYKTILEKKTTLQKELEILNLFVKTDNIYKNRNITISLPKPGNIDTRNTAFLSDVFVPLYENALIKGFVDHSKEYHFTIEIHRSDSLLHCRIYDNGDGIENIDSVIRDKSYLDMLRNRLESYFIIKKVALPKCDVFEISSTVNKGTEIKFIMPYEII